MTRQSVRARLGRAQEAGRTAESRWRRGLGAAIVASAIEAVGLAAMTAGAPSASADDYYLPPCAADEWVEGMAVERFEDGHFKVVLTPTADARAVGRVALNSMWHLVQACVPGLYEETADTVYGQLACHADLGALPGLNGELFATGPTWDFEAWRPPFDEAQSIATKCSAGWQDPYGDDHHEAGSWQVYFGVDPMEKSQQELEQIRADRAAAQAAQAAPGFEQSVYVINTGGQGLWTRGGPGYDAARYQVLPDGTTMTLLCQVHSELIVDWMTSDLWDHVRLADGTEAWVSDVFVKTGSDGQVAPTC